MKLTKTSKHLGESLSMVVLFAIASLSIVGFMAMQPGVMP